MVEKSWFETDRAGLEKIARRRGLAYVLYELIQNCWDTGASVISVEFEAEPGRPRVWVRVADDDPDGFKDLRHAYTMFAESEKKSDPKKRGRFNLGEKLVLAVCESAEIVSTKGSVRFDNEGRHVGRRKRDAGTLFEGLVKMTREELQTVLDAGRLLIPPPGVTTTIDGIPVVGRESIATLRAVLSTEVANADGFLEPRELTTHAHVYRPLTGEPGRIFEMGIPVCETGDPWDIDVQQKVPVNLERNSVSRAYLKALRVHVVNAVADQLKPEEVTTAAVQEAISDKRIDAKALDTVLTKQFGEKRAIFDPSDHEANRRLVAEGYTVIPGRALPSATFANIRTHGTAKPAGKISPSYSPYSDHPDAKPAKFIPEEEWSAAMKNVAQYAHELAWKLMKVPLDVRFEANRMTDPWSANYGGGTLTFNFARVGRAFFEDGVTERLNDLLLHEFAHHFGGHLTDEFDDAMSRLGSKLWHIAMAEPDFFRQFGFKLRG